MFTEAIEKVSNFTRPIHSILRLYKSSQIIPGSSTLFFVNEDGYAITCKHVIDVLTSSENTNKVYNAFKAERDKLTKDEEYEKNLAAIEAKYNYHSETLVQIKSMFMDCADSKSSYAGYVHPRHDLAIIKFSGYDHLLYGGYAKFLRDTSKIRQGKFLCRLGFPFPEFQNFSYNEAKDDIEWTNAGLKVSPRFPIEGMLTRFLAEDNKMYGIEMSTPGLRGQSGGPLFDQNGTVYGMQSSTKHLHLGFDQVDKEIMVNNRVQKVSDYSFIHLGQCIHADIIKEFLAEKKVKFYEED
jgi:hypothetical protein